MGLFDDEVDSTMDEMFDFDRDGHLVLHAAGF